METLEEGGPRGSGLLRHTPRTRSWDAPDTVDDGGAEAVQRHIEQHFGPVAFVWHEFASELVRLDVHVVAPTERRPCYTLVTVGMSDRAMTVPAGDDSLPYAELMLCLPADWPMTTEAFRDENAYWPIRLLKIVARLPHEYGTWVAEWHSVPNGDPAQPYASDTPFVGALLAPMIRTGPEARTITTAAGRRISLLALVPLHAAEMQLKLTAGTDALLDSFDHIAVSELFDPARPSSV
jgi:hypothetical protein